MATIQATEETFDELVNTDYAVVDFYGDWCGPCRELAPIFTAASSDYAIIRFIKVNTDHTPELSKRLEIHAIPTTMYFRNGKPVHRALGSMDRETLDGFIAALLYDYPAPELRDE